MTFPSGPRTFRAKAMVEASGRIIIAVPFDPAAAWGHRDRYDVTGTIDGRPVRTTVQRGEGPVTIVLGPTSGHRPWISHGDEVEVSLRPEGPQAELLSQGVADLDRRNQAPARGPSGAYRPDGGAGQEGPQTAPPVGASWASGRSACGHRAPNGAVGQGWSRHCGRS